MRDVIFEVISGVGGDVGKILLNRPQNLNALNFQMCAGIHQQLAQWAEEKSIKAVIISGAGERAFCAGGDVRALYETLKQSHYEEALNFFRQEYAMNQAIFDFPKPYIAFLDGITMGGGVGVSIHGSHCVATERLIWAMPETRIGFFPDVGVGYHLAKLPCHMGHYLALTGERILAGDASQLGLVKAVVSSEQLGELEHALINTPFNDTDFDVVTQIIETFHQVPDKKLFVNNLPADQIEKYFSRHSVEEIINGLASAKDAACQLVAKTLTAQSPLSLKITHEHLRHCVSFNFQQVMVENCHLVNKFIQSHDFPEGIRAMLVDKDRNPQWHPKTLSEVTTGMVSSFFE